MRREPAADGPRKGLVLRAAAPESSRARASGARASPYTIGKLATLTKVTADTLRYYEREKLVRPLAKSPSGYRLYDEDAVHRVQFVRHAQECGFTLAEIRGLLTLRGRDSACCNDFKRIAIERKLELEARIRNMKSMSAALDRLIGACHREQLPVDACPILLGLDRMAARK